MSDLFKSLIDASVANFRMSKRLAEKAITQLTDEQLCVSLHPETNSIAVIMRHMSGNLQSRWVDFLTTDGEKPDRNRDGEFDEVKPAEVEALMIDWEHGWSCLFGALVSLTPEDAEKTVMIRGTARTIPDAIAESMWHLGYHGGQVVQIARIIVGDKHWNTITIPRGGSAAFNEKVWGK